MEENPAKWLNIQSNSNQPGIWKLSRCKKHCLSYYLCCFVFLNLMMKKVINKTSCEINSIASFKWVTNNFQKMTEYSVIFQWIIDTWNMQNQKPNICDTKGDLWNIKSRCMVQYVNTKIKVYRKFFYNLWRSWSCREAPKNKVQEVKSQNSEVWRHPTGQESFQNER